MAVGITQILQCASCTSDIKVCSAIVFKSYVFRLPVPKNVLTGVGLHDFGLTALKTSVDTERTAELTKQPLLCTQVRDLGNLVPPNVCAVVNPIPQPLTCPLQGCLVGLFPRLSTANHIGLVASQFGQFTWGD